MKPKVGLRSVLDFEGKLGVVVQISASKQDDILGNVTLSPYVVVKMEDGHKYTVAGSEIEAML